MENGSWCCRGAATNERRAGPRIGPVDLVLAALVAAAGFSVDAHASHAGVFFAEPYTGQKVDGYEVTLPVASGERRAFSIPEGCDEAMAAFSTGAMRWGTQIEKRVWGKVAGDCEYHAFLHRFSPETGQDFVSDYDFRNGSLADLMIDDCGGGNGCREEGASRPSVLELLAVDEAPVDPSAFDSESCRLRDGRFRGRVMIDGDAIKCQRDPWAPGFRVISVDFTDVNGDGYLDAVLRLVPLGPGLSRMPLVVAYTRMTPSGPFMVPDTPSSDAVGAQTPVPGPPPSLPEPAFPAPGS